MLKKIFFLTICCLFFNCSNRLSSSDTAAYRNKTPIHSWSYSKVKSIPQFIWLTNENWINQELIIANLKEIPSGKKVLFLHSSFLDTLWTEPKDRLKSGEQGIWWDYGAVELKNKLTNYFKELKKQDVEIDVIVLDIEVGFSNWHLSSKNKNTKGKYYKSLSSDKRMRGIFDELSFKNMDGVERWMNKKEYLEWNALMSKRTDEYINMAIYEPIKKIYPKIQMSNYGSFYWNKKYKIPELNGHSFYSYGNGSHVGTHQSQNFYGRVGQIVEVQNTQGISSKRTPFFAFQYEVFKCKSMLLSSKVPIHAWVANRSFSERNITLLENSDYYQELIFHLLCLGIDRILYFNYHSNYEDDSLLISVLEEFDSFKKNDNPFLNYTISDILDWDENYMISQSAYNEDLFRFTPRLKANKDINDIIISMSPFKFKIDDDIIAFDELYFNPNLKANKNPLSKKGIWLSKIAN